jgi:hypothetical protein
MRSMPLKLCRRETSTLVLKMPMNAARNSEFDNALHTSKVVSTRTFRPRIQTNYELFIYSMVMYRIIPTLEISIGDDIKCDI